MNLMYYLQSACLLIAAGTGHESEMSAAHARAKVARKEYCLIQQTSVTAAALTLVEDVHGEVAEQGGLAERAWLSRDSSDTSTGAARSKDDFKPPEFFGAFHEGESTFDQDAIEEESAIPDSFYNPSRSQDPAFHDALAPRAASAKWFTESRSGGPDQAWQTFYPKVEDALSAVDGQILPWHEESGGRWRQQFDPESVAEHVGQTMKKHAGWFDTHVEQFDAFGRIRSASSHSGRRYLNWTLRTRNASFACENPGCEAFTLLNVFDPAKEHVRHCRLTVGIHPTDFESDFSNEHLEFIRVNAQQLNSNCAPMSSQCNTSISRADLPLYPCITDEHIAHIPGFLGNGSVNVSGKISPLVDECPVEGKYLLSGVAVVECFVRDLPPPPEPPEPAEPSQQTAMAELGENSSKLVRCAERGCTATATLLLHPDLIQGKSCILDILLNQTDFDQDHGSKELVEWVKVGNETVGESLTPGRNPCKERAQGKNATVQPFELVKARNVSVQASTGIVPVSIKISDMVDECGSNGYLLDAFAHVVCS